MSDKRAADLREYIVANMHDGDDGGVMTAPTAAHVDTTVEVVLEWLDERATTLDEAWAAAEAALPEGWRLKGVWEFYDARMGAKPGSWQATALPFPRSRGDGVQASGPTPAAALLALASTLRDSA